MNPTLHDHATDRDDRLVTLAQRGDHAAFAELMRRAAPASLRQATSILRNHELAEDEVQNAYLSAWRHLDQFQGKAKFTTWINRIVTNQCLMRLRTLRKTSACSLDHRRHAEITAPPETSDLSATPEARFGTKEQAAALGKEIGLLPPTMRSVLLLRDMQEMSTREAATNLGISTAAVKSRLLRARLALRRRLDRLVPRSGCLAVSTR